MNIIGLLEIIKKNRNMDKVNKSELGKMLTILCNIVRKYKLNIDKICKS